MEKYLDRLQSKFILAVPRIRTSAAGVRGLMIHLKGTGYLLIKGKRIQSCTYFNAMIILTPVLHR